MKSWTQNICKVLMIAIMLVAFSGTRGLAQAEIISYWHFDEGSGQVAYDSVGTNDGRLGSTTGVDINDPLWTSGVLGALHYDGLNDYVYVADSQSLHFGTAPFSIQMWIKANTFVGRSRPVEGIRVLNKSLYPRTWWVVDIFPDGLVQMEMGDSNSVIAREPSICAITINNWYHIAIVVDRFNFEVRYFINGTPAGILPIPPAFVGNLDVQGRYLDIGSLTWNTFNGIIDELAIYRGTLSAEEIAQKYMSDLQLLGEAPGPLECPEIPVLIDIKPGSDPNCFNNNGHGVIPVAILGSSDFDVRDIVAGSVELDAQSVKAVGKSNKLLAHYEDVNYDGYEDLVVQIEDYNGVYAEGDTTGTLTGYLYDGTRIAGFDTICIVP